MKNSIKKIISTFLIAGVTLSNFGGITLNALAESTGSLSVTESFDGESVNTSFISGNGAVASDPSNSENHVWKIENAGGSMTTLITNLRPAAFLNGVPAEKTGKLTYEYMVYIPSNNPMDGGGYYPIVNQIKQYEGMAVGIVRPNIVFRQNWQEAVTIENGFDSWFSVKYVFDYETMTFDAYAQDKQFENGTSFKDGLPANKNYYDPIEGLHIRAYVPSGFTYYIDDLKVSYSDKAVEPEITQLITGISVKGVNIDSFSKEIKNYEIELSEADFNALAQADVAVSVVSEHQDVVPQVTIGSETDNKKTITVTASKNDYTETYTVVCIKKVPVVILPSEENNKFAAENFDGATYNTSFITGTGAITQDPENADNKVFKIENTTSGMTTMITDVKPLAKITLPTEDKRIGKLVYEYDVYFPSSNPLERDVYHYPISNVIKQYEGMTLGQIRPINALYGSNTVTFRKSQLDKWFTIRYIFDYETETYDAYANGVQFVNGVSYKTAVPQNKKYYDPSEGLHLRAYVPASWTYYIDNVNVNYVEVTPDFVKGIKTFDGEEYNEVTDFAADKYEYDGGVYAEYFSSIDTIENLVKVELEEGYEDAKVEIGIGQEENSVLPVTVTVSTGQFVKLYKINYKAKLRPFYSGTLTEDFEGKTPSTLEKFVSRTGGGVTEIVQDEEHGDVLKVTESAVANNYFFDIDASSMKPNGFDNAKLIYELDFKIDDKYKTLQDVKGEDTPISVRFNNKGVASLRWYNIIVGSSTFKFNDATEPTDATWEHLKIVIDCDTKEFAYYLDNSEVPQITTINESLTFDDLFKFRLHWWNGAKLLADVYIDNVSVSYVVSHPEMIDEIKVFDKAIESFDNKNYIYNIDVYEDLYKTLTAENIDVVLDLKYQDTVVEKTVTEIEDMKVIEVSLKNGLFEANYKINCFDKLRPATLEIKTCVANEYSVSFDAYIEDELKNPVSRDITAICYKAGEEPIGDTTTFFGMVTSGADGSAKGEILVFDEDTTPTFYTMEVLLDAYAIGDEPVKTTVLYVNNSQLEESIKWLKASDKDVLSYIATEDSTNSVTAEDNNEIFRRMNVWVDEYLNTTSENQQKMRDMAVAYKAELTVENIDELVNASIMAVLLGDKDITDEKALELIKKYDSEVKNIVVSEQNFNALSDDKQKWVTENLLTRNDIFADATDVLTEVRTSMLISKINDTPYTALEKLILDNEDLFGEENVKALKDEKKQGVKDKAMQELVKAATKNEFTTVDGILATLDEAIEKAQSSGGSSGSSSSSSSSSSGGSKNPIALGGVNVGTTTPAETPTETPSVFSDLSGYDWAKDAILALNKKGIVSGVGNGKFEPGRVVNREEFAKLLCETFGLEKADEASSFTDVANGSWYEVYVMTANKHGIINGVEESVFGTGRNITREDMVTMLYRAICAKGIEISDEGTVFEDDNEISDYAKDAVLKMCAKGVVNGVGENKFAPKKSATRAEAAVILKRVTDTFLD